MIQEWYYKDKAEMRYGDSKSYLWPKILLIVSIVVILAVGVSAYICRDYVYDITMNPQLVLKAVISQDENGYYVDVPYKYNFVADKFIDENETLKYNEFMDPNNTDYTYSIEGDVDTTHLGEYPVTFTSQNKVQSQQIVVNVRVKDNVKPTIVLKAKLSDIEGIYEPIKVVRNSHNTDEYLGTLDFKQEDFIESITDDYSPDDKLKIEYTENLGLDEGEGTKTVNITYSATDEAGNKAVVTLPLTIYDASDPDLEAETERVKQMEDELNRLFNQAKKKPESNPDDN